MRAQRTLSSRESRPSDALPRQARQDARLTRVEANCLGEIFGRDFRIRDSSPRNAKTLRQTNQVLLALEKNQPVFITAAWECKPQYVCPRGRGRRTGATENKPKIASVHSDPRFQVAANSHSTARRCFSVVTDALRPARPWRALARGYPKRGRRRGKSSQASRLAHSFAQLFRVNIHANRSGRDAFTAPPPPFRIPSSS